MKASEAGLPVKDQAQGKRPSGADGHIGFSEPGEILSSSWSQALDSVPGDVQALLQGLSE